MVESCKTSRTSKVKYSGGISARTKGVCLKQKALFNATAAAADDVFPDLHAATLYIFDIHT